MIAKASIFGFGLLAGGATAAFTADLPTQYSPPMYAPAAMPIFTWTGFYAGVNVGGVIDNRNQFSLAGVTPANQVPANTYARDPYASGHASGFTGGGQIGVNYQLHNNVVVGVEADASYTDLGATEDDALPAGAGRVFHSRLDFLGTVRGRLGYTLNRLLVFGTGGFAYGQTDSSVALFNNGNTVTRFGGSANQMQTGYAVGGGIEYALPPISIFAGLGSHAATIKAEYLHYDLGSTNVLASANAAAFTVGAYNARLSTSGDLVRAGLNFKY